MESEDFIPHVTVLVGVHCSVFSDNPKQTMRLEVFICLIETTVFVGIPTLA